MVYYFTYISKTYTPNDYGILINSETKQFYIWKATMYRPTKAKKIIKEYCCLPIPLQTKKDFSELVNQLRQDKSLEEI